jgi:Arc/MetJ-type ribon-helix-helix transcriptional regulator
MTSDLVRDLLQQDQDRTTGLRWLQTEIDKGRASPIDPRPHGEIIAAARLQGRG